MSLWRELKRRRVVQVAIGYIVIGWALIEGAATLFPMFDAPAWVPRSVTILILLGFPIAVLMAWALQITPEGIVSEAKRSAASKAADPGAARFVTAPDGVQLAYAISGEGPPMIKTAHWLTHLELDWHSPVWGHWIRALGEGHQMLRYDQRGNGLSDRNPDDLSLDAMVGDLETIVEASGFERFSLVGNSQGGPVSIVYAVRHPERVKAMVIYGSYAKGWSMRSDEELVARERAMVDLVRVGWGQDNPAFRQMFQSLFIPDASEEQAESFDAITRATASPEVAARLLGHLGEIDVMEYLPQVRVPTLVLHVRDDARIPYSQGRLLASQIPDAELVTLEGRNHILLEHEPAFRHCTKAIQDFLARHEA